MMEQPSTHENARVETRRSCLQIVVDFHLNVFTLANSDQCWCIRAYIGAGVVANPIRIACLHLEYPTGYQCDDLCSENRWRMTIEFRQSGLGNAA